MANYIFNIAKGRAVEFYNRVESNDPTNSAFILVPLSASGSEAEAQDYDDLTAVLGGTANELSGNGWVRKTLESVELASLPAPVDASNYYSISVPQVTWTAPTVGTATGLLICFDSDTTGGTDANIIPIGHYDFAVVSDGNDVVLNAGEFLRAS